MGVAVKAEWLRGIRGIMPGDDKTGSERPIRSQKDGAAEAKASHPSERLRSRP
jgi:hypothetical protein